jgi:hypothetical protein
MVRTHGPPYVPVSKGRFYAKVFRITASDIQMSLPTFPCERPRAVKRTVGNVPVDLACVVYRIKLAAATPAFAAYLTYTNFQHPRSRTLKHCDAKQNQGLDDAIQIMRHSCTLHTAACKPCNVKGSRAGVCPCAAADTAGTSWLPQLRPGSWQVCAACLQRLPSWL